MKNTLVRVVEIKNVKLHFLATSSKHITQGIFAALSIKK